MDPFLKTFLPLYENNVKLRESLLVALLHIFCQNQKVAGHQNPELSALAMNFFIATEATSRKGFDIVSGILLGPSLQTVQRNNSMRRHDLCVKVDEERIKRKFIDEMKPHLDEQGGPVAFSLSFDGTKVPKALSISTQHKAIFGGAVPDYCISIINMQEEEVKNILAPTSNIFCADEIKLAVVAVQQHNKAKSPFFVLAAQPQTINLVSNFNNVVTAACMAA
jgi:hypothetical protein